MPGIQFDVIKSDCNSTGATFTVEIDNPSKYAYLWEANGKHAGHAMSTYCLCGDYAKVRVMRLSDGIQAYKTIRLRECLVKNAPNYDLEF